MSLPPVDAAAVEAACKVPHVPDYALYYLSDPAWLPHSHCTAVHHSIACFSAFPRPEGSIQPVFCRS